MEEENRVVRTEEPIEGEVTRSGWVPPKLTRWTFWGDDFPKLFEIVFSFVALGFLTLLMKACGVMH